MIKHNNKLFTTVTGLIYPAFLGAWIYNVSEDVFGITEGTSTMQFVQVSLIVALLVLYVTDYIHTFDETLEKYRLPQFALDLAILVCLFGCLMYSSDDNFADHLLKLWILLAVAKAVGLIWDVLDSDWTGLRIDVPFVVLYCLGAFFLQTNSWILVLICFADAILYWPYSRWRKGNSAPSKACCQSAMDKPDSVSR
ncbi:MAG: hypothetical protein AAF357_07200 [Verrucomicrobiota bacterium]